MIRSSGGIQVKWVKKLRIHPPRAATLKTDLGVAAFHAIRVRVLATQKLGTGEALPRYRKGWFIAAADDPRYVVAGSEPTRMTMTDAGVRFAKGPPRQRLWREGYPAAKGKLPRSLSDGRLSGTMWEHGRVTLGTSGGGQVIRIGFGGRGGKKGALTNQAKADAFQRRTSEGKRTVTPQFALMSLTRDEASDLFAAYTRGLRLLR